MDQFELEEQYQSFLKQLDLIVASARQRAYEDHVRYATLEHLLWGMLWNEGARKVAGDFFSFEPLISFLDEYLSQEAQSSEFKLDPDETINGVQLTVSFNRIIKEVSEVNIEELEDSTFDPFKMLWLEILKEEDSDAAFLILRFRVLNEKVEEAEPSTERHGEETSKELMDFFIEAAQPRTELQDSEIPYCKNLTKLVVEGQSGLLIGRKKEMGKICLVLSRLIKNNALLLGEGGVGKTTLARGLAGYLQQLDPSSPLAGAQVFSLDVTALKAGTAFRGSLEERIVSLIESLKELNKAILIIDDFHQLLSTKSDSVVPIDIIKPSLEDGSIRVLAATTYEELRSSESFSPSILRFFQRIDVKEPSAEESLAILRGCSAKFEKYHQVIYSEEVLRKIVEDSQRYISDRKLPDKAVDVLDEVGALHRLKGKGTEVRPEEVDEVISKLARIPLKTVSESDSDKLRCLSEGLKRKIYGQDHAIEALVNALKLSKSGLTSPERPIGTFLLTGPTGVGKTELARQVALQMGMEFVRFDMSEFSESYSVSKLLGSAPGYVGYERGGLLTEAVSKSPHCVLLLDELEKAHPVIYNVLLQVMDYGLLTDASGKKTDFRNTLLLMTTNAGASDYEKLNIGFGESKAAGSGDEGLKRTFTPEFRNRFDEIIHFNPLGQEQIRLVADKFLNELAVLLLSKHISISFTESLRRYIARKGFNPRMGARPMNAFIQKNIKRELADMMLFGPLSEAKKATAPLKVRVDIGEEENIKFSLD